MYGSDFQFFYLEYMNAYGADVIIATQKYFDGYADFLEGLNFLTSPNHGYTIVCPLIATIDSVFGAQCLVTIATANWINILLKWSFGEDRPYWWVKETRYYGPLTNNKPKFKITDQTCETGPGSPSGHLMYITCLSILLVTWIMGTIFKTYGITPRFLIKSTLYIICGVMLVGVAIARVFIAAHFPHQCVLGFLVGTTILKFVNDIIVTPTVTPTTARSSMKTYGPRQPWINAIYAFMVITSSVTFYWILMHFGIDPQWTIKKAFKWCPNREFIHVTTTPAYTLVESGGTLIGFALSASPYLQKHRFNSVDNSLIISFASAIFFHVILQQLQDGISRDEPTAFYSANSFVYILRVFIYLRVVPMFGSIRTYWRKKFDPRKTQENIVAENIKSRSL